MHLPTGEQMSIYDAAMKYQAARHAADRPRGQGVRLGSARATGPRRARCCSASGRDRRELRAHPPLEPGRHGRRCRCSSEPGETAESLGLKGDETFDIVGLGLDRAKEVQVTGDRRDRQEELQGRRAHRYAEGAGLLHPRRDSAVRAAAARVGQASGIAPPGDLDECGAGSPLPASLRHELDLRKPPGARDDFLVRQIVSGHDIESALRHLEAVPI